MRKNTGTRQDNDSFSTAELLDEGCTFLKELHGFVLQGADLYRAGNERVANEHFIELTHGLEWLVKLTTAAQQHPELDLAAVLADRSSSSMPVDGLNQILKDIISAQEQQDLVLLTDLLEYELAPQVEFWVGVFDGLKNNFVPQ